MPRSRGRNDDCTKADAKARLRRATEFLEVADLVIGERVETPLDEDAINLSGVAGALAVLAGIAASDAATCHRLKVRARGQDHLEAVGLVKTVEPNGAELAKDLKRLLDLKDTAQYGVLGLSDGEAQKAVDWARRMVTNAREVLET